MATKVSATKKQATKGHLSAAPPLRWTEEEQAAVLKRLADARATMAAAVVAYDAVTGNTFREIPYFIGEADAALVRAVGLLTSELLEDEHEIDRDVVREARDLIAEARRGLVCVSCPLDEVGVTAQQDGAKAVSA